MKAFLINPETQSIDEVEYGGTLGEIRSFIDAALFDVVRLGENGDVLYVDDEGLMTKDHYFTWYGVPSPLAGRALLLGTDHEGNSVPPAMSLELVHEKVVWLRAEDALELARAADAAAEAYGEQFGDSFIHISIAPMLEERMNRRAEDGV